MRLALALALAAGCGGSPPPAGPANANPPGVVTDTRSELERRRDVACERVGTKLTECALADAKAELAAGRISKREFELTTAPAVLSKNTEEFVKACRVPLSSRQVRVLEVCLREEPQCGPLGDCLTHLNDKAVK